MWRGSGEKNNCLNTLDLGSVKQVYLQRKKGTEKLLGRYRSQVHLIIKMFGEAESLKVLALDACMSYSS